MRFLAVFLTALAMLSLLYAAFVRVVDPYGDFGTGVFPVVEPDLRAEKMRLFRAYQAQAPVEGLILGSSRAMKLSPRTLEQATGYRFFNFAVDSARAEDDLAIYRWAREQGARIKMLLIGLDVEALHNDDRPEASLLDNDALVRTLGPRSLPQPGLLAPVRGFGLVRLVKRYKAAFTIQAFRDAVRSVRTFTRPRARALPLMEFAPDGYLRYRRWEQERAAGTFRYDRDMDRCLTKALTRFSTMTGLSPRRRAYLSDTVDEARADGAEVALWITSLHPITERYLGTHSGYEALLAATRDYERTLGEREGVAAYDFSEVESYRGSASGWYDCLHIDDANAERVATALVSERR